MIHKILYNKAPSWIPGEGLDDNEFIGKNKYPVPHAMASSDHYPGDYAGKIIAIDKISAAEEALDNRGVVEIDLSDEEYISAISHKLKVVRGKVVPVTFEDKYGSATKEILEEIPEDGEAERQDKAANRTHRKAVHDITQLNIQKIKSGETKKLLPLPAKPETKFKRVSRKHIKSLPGMLCHTGAGLYEVGPAKTYATIQSALDQLWTDQGGTEFGAIQEIRVFADTYVENVTANAGLRPTARYPLQIRANTGDTSILASSGAADALDLNDVDNVLVEDIEVTPTGTGAHDHVTNLGASCRISGCTIDGTYEDGIVSDASGCVIESCTFGSDIARFNIHSSEQITIKHNTIVNDIYIGSAYGAIVESNTFSGAPLIFDGDAQTPVGVYGATVYNNTFYNYAVALISYATGSNVFSAISKDNIFDTISTVYAVSTGAVTRLDSDRNCYYNVTNFASFDGPAVWTQAAPKLGAETDINATVVFDGVLYAGTAPNGKLYKYVPGTGWVEVAGKLGAETYIQALAVLNGEIYGGTSLNGKLYKYVPGTGWVEVAGQLGAGAEIKAMVVLGGELYAGISPIGKLYKWNGVDAWVEVAGKLGAETYIFSMVVMDGEIYGGTFPNGKLYKWNGVDAWVEVAGKLGAETYIFSLAVLNGEIYAGTFPNGKLYKWNGVDAWVEVVGKLGAETRIRTLTIMNGDIYGGTSPNGNLLTWGPTYYTTLAAWQAWADMDGNSPDSLSFVDDPDMADPANDDFTLDDTSPCHNAGLGTGVVEDVAGNVRHRQYPTIGASETTGLAGFLPYWSGDDAGLLLTATNNSIEVQWDAAIHPTAAELEYRVRLAITGEAWSREIKVTGTNTELYDVAPSLHEYTVDVSARPLLISNAWTQATSGSSGTAGNTPVPVSQSAQSLDEEGLLDIKLEYTDNDPDVLLAGFDLALADGATQLSQHLHTRIGTFRGEWFLDENEGFPWLEDVLIKAPDLDLISAQLKAYILQTQGVNKIIEFDLSQDSSTRNLSVTFTVTTDFGPIQVAQEVI